MPKDTRRARPNEEIVTHWQSVFPDFFPAMGIRLVRGRLLADTDRDTLAPVAVVNETFVRRVFPNEDPIGKRVKIGGLASSDPWTTIVGVVRDYRHYRLPQPMGPAMYLSYAEAQSRSQTLTIRTTAVGSICTRSERARRVARDRPTDGGLRREDDGRRREPVAVAAAAARPGARGSSRRSRSCWRRSASTASSRTRSRSARARSVCASPSARSGGTFSAMVLRRARRSPQWASRSASARHCSCRARSRRCSMA